MAETNIKPQVGDIWKFIGYDLIYSLQEGPICLLIEQLDSTEEEITLFNGFTLNKSMYEECGFHKNHMHLWEKVA